MNSKAIAEVIDLSLTDITRWLDQPALAELVGMFDGKFPRDGSLCARLDDLEEFSIVWDMRGGKHRLDMEQLSLDPATEAKISELLTALGFREAGAPSWRDYDWALVLGGLANSCIGRTEFAASIVGAGTIRPTSGVGLLGSFRPLHDDEQAVANTLAPDLTNEISCLLAAADRFFGSSSTWDSTVDMDPSGNPHKSQAIHRREEQGVTLVGLAARSSDPDKRYANTGDTYNLFASFEGSKAGSRVLLITSAIYRQYQHFDALRMLGLPAGIQVDTVGYTPVVEPAHFTTTWYLQEVRSTIRSAHALARAVQQAEMDAN